MLFSERATCQLTPAPHGGTRLHVHERGRTTAMEFLDRLIYSFMLTKVQPTTKVLEKLGQCIAEDLAREQVAEASGVPVTTGTG